MLDLIRRYGDDPVMVSENWLRLTNATERERWIATVKHDGWRRFIYWQDGQAVLLSKARGKGDEARRPLPDDLMKQLMEVLKTAPDGTALDAEWVGPRGHFDDHLVFHDLIYLNGQDVWRLGYEERYNLLGKFHQDSRAAISCPRIVLVKAWRVEDLEKLFEAQKSDPESEGLVLKKVGIPMTADTGKVRDNPDYVKVKYRDVKGSDMAYRKWKS